VLEYLDGRDWGHDIDTEGPQPLGKTVHIASQVCRALSAAHAKGIIHRDLKPPNIVLIERGGDPNFAKDVDFGISKFQRHMMPAEGAGLRTLTDSGMPLGTPYYMSPEQCHARKDIDGRTDIYQLGVILYHALTGSFPFLEESYPLLMMKIVSDSPTD